MEIRKAKKQKCAVLQGKARELVLRLRDYFSKECLNNGPLIPVTRVTDRVANALGISKKLVLRIFQEEEESADEEISVDEKCDIKNAIVLEEKQEEVKDPVEELFVNKVVKNAIKLHAYLFNEKNPNASDADLLESLKLSGLFKGTLSNLLKILGKIPEEDNTNGCVEKSKHYDKVAAPKVVNEEFVREHDELFLMSKTSSEYNNNISKNGHDVIGEPVDELLNNVYEIENEHVDPHNVMHNQKKVTGTYTDKNLVFNDSSSEESNKDYAVIEETMNKDLNLKVSVDCEKLENNDNFKSSETITDTEHQEHKVKNRLKKMSKTKKLRTAVILHADLFYKIHPNGSFKRLVRSYKKAGLFRGAYKTLLRNMGYCKDVNPNKREENRKSYNIENKIEDAKEPMAVIPDVDSKPVIQTKRTCKRKKVSNAVTQTKRTYKRRKADVAIPTSIENTIKVEKESDVERDREIQTEGGKENRDANVTVIKEEIENDYDEYFEAEEFILNLKDCLNSR